MERRFFMNDFEQSLKDQADQFKMIPSKRVWHGIYNDLHPGRRWPSVTMSLLLIFTLVVIGRLNTRNSLQSVASSANIAKSKNVTGNWIATEISTVNKKIALKNSELKNSSEAGASAIQFHNTGLPANATVNYYQNKTLLTHRLLANNLKARNNSVSSDFEKKAILLPEINSNTGAGNMELNRYPDEESQLTNNIDLVGEANQILNEKNDVNYFDISQPAKNISIDNQGNLNIYNFLLVNFIDKVIAEKISPDSYRKIARLHKKRNEKINWVYYVTPVLNSVSFSGEALKQSPNANFSPAVAINQKQNSVLHNSRLGLQAGVQMNYTITKKLLLTTGAQISYSGYNIISNEVHPTFATLVLKDYTTGMNYEQTYITHFGDGTGQTPVVLRNYNWQASIPVGLQYELFGNNKIQFNAAANIEPSLVLKSNAYILSSDGNNYVNDPALLRKWNVSSNFGAFITFSSSKFKWQVGPNLRYQWLSTYKRDYTIKEHLIDYGIRIGISK